MLPTRRPQRRHLRILVEAPAPYSFSVKEAASISDCDVVHCSGPSAGKDCPLLHGNPCPPADAADVVVASLGLDTAQSRDLLVGLKALHPDLPRIVLAWRADLDRHADLLEGCTVVTFPWTFTKLRTAISEMVATRSTRIIDLTGGAATAPSPADDAPCSVDEM